MKPGQLIATAAVFCSTALAQTAVTSGGAVVHTVTAGKGDNLFKPSVVYANPGDIITFQFYPSNHSVIRAQYGYPCIPYEDTTGQPGFYSGHFAVTSAVGNLPTWNLTINDTLPVFYYCSAPGSCINYGMVGVINPNSSTSIDTQIALAKTSDYMLEPGQPFPAEASSSVASLAYTATATTVTVSVSVSSSSSVTPPVTSSPTATPAPSSGSLQGGAIAGIAVGAAAAVLICAALFYLIGRNRSLSNALHRGLSNEPDMGQTRRPIAGGGGGVGSGAAAFDDQNRTSFLPPYPQGHQDYKPVGQEALVSATAQEAQHTIYHPRYGAYSPLGGTNQQSRYSSATSETANEQTASVRGFGPVSPPRSPALHELSAPDRRIPEELQ